MLKAIDQKQIRKPKQFRLPTSVIDLLDRVAKTQGRSQTDVVVDATIAYGEEALLTQADMAWNAAAFEAFAAAVKAPPQPSAYVLAARQKKRIWE